MTMLEAGADDDLSIAESGLSPRRHRWKLRYLLEGMVV